MSTSDWEKQLEGWSRAKKIVLIESANPRWVDLAKDWPAWMKDTAGDRDASTAEDQPQTAGPRCSA